MKLHSLLQRRRSCVGWWNIFPIFDTKDQKTQFQQDSVQRPFNHYSPCFQFPHFFGYCTNYLAIYSTVAAERGSEGGIRPGRHTAGAAFGGSKLWKSKIWPLLANWRLHYRQWYFYILLTPLTQGLTEWHSGPRQLSVLHDSTQSSVYIKKLTLVIWLIIHLLQKCRRSILSSYCSGNRNSMFCTIHVFPDSAWNLVNWFS